MEFVDAHEARSEAPSEVAKRFGVKASGLLTIPDNWCPRFRLASGELYRAWIKNNLTFSLESRKSIAQQLPELIGALGSSCELRSSASDETLRERGRYLSNSVDLMAGVAPFLDSVRAVFADYEAKNSSGEMALILQTRVEVVRMGFLSNEIRAAAKPYQWVVETQIATTKGATTQIANVSAKQAQDYDTDHPLICTTRSELTARLRSVARYFWRSAQGRVLLEWCWDGARLWIVQRDQCPDTPGGTDPTRIVDRATAAPQLQDGRHFRRFQVGSSSPWGKLKKVERFTTGDTPPPHRLFYATAAVIRSALATSVDDLAVEIDNLTAGRAVIRTDHTEGGYNLPHTNTVDGDQAVAWLSDQLARTPDDSNTIFILHAFIHAGASAWSYYKKGDSSVRVDGLWGLADGMQFYPCDTFLYFLDAAKEVATTRFKSHVLVEDEHGEWSVAEVQDSSARHRSLTKAHVRDIAERTAEIARRTESDVQIMWFADIPSKFQLGLNLPWFMATPEQDVVEQRSHLLRSVVVRTSEDLRRLEGYPPGSAKVILEPAASDIRNSDFIEAVAETCRRLRLPVELRGSILSHAFHQLRQAGVQVFSAEPGKTSTTFRQRKSYDKLVRDNIPQVIERGGEHASTAQLQQAELQNALIGKLVEELAEFASAQDKSARLEELADVLEVIRGLASTAGLTLGEIEVVAARKREKRGGFEQGIILRSTSLESTEEATGNLFGEGDDGRIRMGDLGERHKRPERTSIPIGDLLSGMMVENDLERGQVRVSIRVEVHGSNVEVTLVRVEDRSDRDQPDLLWPPAQS